MTEIAIRDTTLQSLVPRPGMIRMSRVQHHAPSSAVPPPLPADMVARAAAGDRQAMRRLYEATVGRIYALMVRMVGHQDAEDLTQQSYVRAFTKLNQFSGDAKFETWLYRLATNEALQHLRREKVRRTQPLQYDIAKAPPDPAETRDQVRQLRQALAKLSPESRAVFTLKEELGLSYREIASTLDIAEGTVGSRLNRARRELKGILRRTKNSS